MVSSVGGDGAAFIGGGRLRGRGRDPRDVRSPSSDLGGQAVRIGLWGRDPWEGHDPYDKRSPPSDLEGVSGRLGCAIHVTSGLRPQIWKV